MVNILLFISLLLVVVGAAGTLGALLVLHLMEYRNREVFLASQKDLSANMTIVIVKHKGRKKTITLRGLWDVDKRWKVTSARS